MASCRLRVLTPRSLQLLRGGSRELLASLHLQDDPALYQFTAEGAAATVSPSPPQTPLLVEL